MDSETDPKESNSEDEYFSYTRVVVPSNMRSQYWKYFGFPSNNLNHILTKRKVICTICSTAISYNKNTSNLRTHLVAKHLDALTELVGTEKKNHVEIMAPSDKQIKISQHKECPISGMMIEVKNGDDYDNGEDKFVEKLSISQAAIEYENELGEKGGIEIEYNDQEDSNSVEQTNYVVEGIDDIRELNNSIEIILNMLILDLHPLSFVEQNGFLNFVWALRPGYNVPSINELKPIVDKMYNEKLLKITELIKTHATSNPFSMSFEIWTNIEKTELISIYFNYVTENPCCLNNLLYTTVEVDSDLEEILCGINLKNCSAIVMNKENDRIIEFFSGHDIPIVPCFESVIQKCLAMVFHNELLIDLVKKISKYYEKNPDIADEDFIPNIYEDIPLTKYEYMKFFCDSETNYVSLADEDNYQQPLFKKVKEIVDLLTPLKVSLETLSDEPNALSSLIKPLTTKLVEQHFFCYETDSENISDIKSTINQELFQSISLNNFLTISSFLDPRFQSFTETHSIETIKSTFCRKLNLNKTSNQSFSKNENSNSKRSRLSNFFSDSDAKRNIPISKSNFETEFSRYVNEAYIDLEQCPLIWWNENAYMYRQLRKFATNYNSVPACVNSNFKRNTEEKIDFLDKRILLRNKFDYKILFLNLNKNKFN